MIRNTIITVIDFFYLPPFKKIMPLQTFRYAACGGSNMMLDILLFYVSFHYILHEHLLNLGFVTLKPYNAALGMAFCISCPIGFLLSKYIVFNSSDLRGRIQLFRYILVVAINLLLNYSFLNIMIEMMHFYPTVARIFATAIIVTFSYLSQKHFTFRERKGSHEI